MPVYDSSRYDPPAPVAIVGVRRSGSEDSVGNVSLLIDTGADIALLPRWAITRLGLTPEPGMRYELIGFDGVRSSAEGVELEMLFLNRAFRGRYVVSDEEHGILGRDVLASLRMMLDGPGQEWSEVAEP
ncbi:MAG TPA: aspartyl protease family protein [Tepidisphaeraceae bacterium]|jgi:hypothetical protein|nr:aspartyl protease family protein [Tepidisphaeraceae bacterium]